jgi:hypothetical protein
MVVDMTIDKGGRRTDRRPKIMRDERYDLQRVDGKIVVVDIWHGSLVDYVSYHYHIGNNH